MVQCFSRDDAPLKLKKENFADQPVLSLRFDSKRPPPPQFSFDSTFKTLRMG